MAPFGRGGGRSERRPALTAGQGAPEATHHDPGAETDVVFDFAGLKGLDLPDLALVLTARLHAGPTDRVWVRQIPYEAWEILRALGLDHLFHVYPGPGDELN